MKRESSHEPAVEPISSDKRPKLDTQPFATESACDKPLESARGAGSQSTGSPKPVEIEKTGPSIELDAPAPSTNHDSPAARVETNPGSSTSTGKNKSRGRGRGRGRDQRARTDRNAEKAGRKREWASRGTREDGQANEAEDGQERGPRLPKKKVAILIGFCGTGYNGMQIQREAHTNTIENTLFDALVKAGAVSKDNSDDPVKVNLQRAARTDAGVHAAGNLVSLKMITEPPDTPDLVARLNELLPPEIRVWKYVRATNTFNSRACDSRVYEYMFPSHALLPPRPGTPMELHTKPTNPSESSVGPDWTYWEKPNASELGTMRAWRIGRGQFEGLRESAKVYEGTHHFHNFTVGLEHSDPSGLRYMLNIDVREPYVIDNVEWISIMYHGQSFMLHQRKMTTLLIFASRTGTPATSLIPQTFASSKLIIPKAPSLGLLLQEPRFGTYNKHIADENELATGRGDLDRLREPIDWDPLRETIDEFKKTFIYSRIRAEEAKHGVFAAWLKFIDEYDGPEFKYLNPRGEIPAEAVVHRGKRKRGATDKFREYLWKNPAGKGVAGAESSDDESEEEGNKPSAEMEG